MANKSPPMNCDFEEIDAIAQLLMKDSTTKPPTVGIICGSGLSTITKLLANPRSVPYADIPGFPTAHVAGHGNELVFGDFDGVQVVCMKGRFHFYSGYTMQQVVIGVRVMARLGVKKLVVTNAAGGLNPEYNVGDVIVIADHINLPGLCGLNPLVGQNDPRMGPRFPPMSDVYDPAMQAAVLNVADDLGFKSWIRSGGKYAAVIGPSYETPSECSFLRSIGGDCVGMSTIPEVIAARHAGMTVLCLSLISNKVVYKAGEPPANHKEVLAAVDTRVAQLPTLVRDVVIQIGHQVATEAGEGAEKSSDAGGASADTQS